MPHTSTFSDVLSTASSLAPSVGSLPSLNDTYGALLLGSFLNILLYGLALHQLYRYFRFCPTDTPFIRAIVSIAMLLETLHSAFAIHACYYYLVSNYFDPLVLLRGVWSLNCFPVIGAGVMISTQTFFIRRVSIIAFEFKVLATLAAAFTLAKFGLIVDLTVKVFKTNSVEAFIYEIGLISATFSTAVVADVLLTGALIAVLQRGRVTQKGDHSFWDTAVIYGINTGLLIAIFDLVTLILAVAARNTVWWSALNQVTVKLYVNTLLCVLNSRNIPKVPVVSTKAYSMSAIARANRTATAERFNSPQLPEPPRILDIRVTTEIEGDLPSPKPLIKKGTSESSLSIV
ncbi:hypothetical protein L226DRAFT_575199 [Lentinus tigrinus ALCF2SS1-7]|uniref:uncharacterized protein n=1 Tax=Lentinus tigrinus ALCF2SS1-7 TaxID=1328758 RepID=UPI001165EEE3|nr:hypothetical protein L226DRAFT_575199 [Lentinus tigrinus ALCF2SS1-7]